MLCWLAETECHWMSWLLAGTSLLRDQWKAKSRRWWNNQETWYRYWGDKLNFPITSEQVIRSKLKNVLHIYENFTKKGNLDLLENLPRITEDPGKSFNTADRNMYSIHLKIGYLTGRAAHGDSNLPSKRRCLIFFVKSNVLGFWWWSWRSYWRVQLRWRRQSRLIQ